MAASTVVASALRTTPSNLSHPSAPAVPRHCHPRGTDQLRQSRFVGAHSFTLRHQGKEFSVSKDSFIIGSDSSCDLQLPSQLNVSPRHVTLTSKRAGLFCTATVGEETWDPSYTWIDGQELRPKVAYLLGSGNSIAIGQPDNIVTVTFQESSGSNPLAEMLMQGMAKTDEVRQQLNKGKQ